MTVVRSTTRTCTVHPPGRKLARDESQWQRLSDNALRIGEMFTRDNVLKLYRSHWDSLFESKQAQPIA
jgi:hypothetical protein